MTRRGFVGALFAVTLALHIDPMKVLAIAPKKYKQPWAIELLNNRVTTLMWGKSIKFWPEKLYISPELYDAYDNQLTKNYRFVFNDTKSDAEPQLVFKSMRVFRDKYKEGMEMLFVHRDSSMTYMNSEGDITFATYRA